MLFKGHYHTETDVMKDKSWWNLRICCLRCCLRIIIVLFKGHYHTETDVTKDRSW